MEEPNLDGRIELDDVLAKAKLNTTNFINHLEQEEAGERVETTDSLINQIKADKTNTDRKKLQFINEMKSGVGNEIKEQKANGVKIKKITLKGRIKKFFLLLYSKF